MIGICWDRFQGSPPDDGFDVWVDEIVEEFSDATWDDIEDWFILTYGVCNKWLNALFMRKIRYNPKQASRIIERAYRKRQKTGESPVMVKRQTQNHGN